MHSRLLHILCEHAVAQVKVGQTVQHSGTIFFPLPLYPAPKDDTDGAALS